MGEDQERRGAERVAPQKGRALIQDDEEALGRKYAVEDFSQAGCRLRGEPVPPVGKRVRTFLFAGGRGGAEAWGEVTRHSDDGKSFAIKFEELDSFEELVLEDLVARVLFDEE